MQKYLITWDAGFGESAEICEAESEDDATQEAYECWKQEAESNAEYGAVPLTKDLAEEHGLDWEDE